MKLWFINKLYVEKEETADIIAELDNEFSKHNILTCAGCYDTADLVEVILLACGRVDKDFVKCIVADLKQTKIELNEAESKLQEIRNGVRFDDNEFKQLLSMVNDEIYSLSFKEDKLSLERMEVIKNKLETILNRG